MIAKAVLRGKGQLYTTLKIACQKNGPTQAKEALLAWGRARFPKALLSNIMDISQHASSLDFCQAIDISIVYFTMERVELGMATRSGKLFWRLQKSLLRIEKVMVMIFRHFIPIKKVPK